MSSANPANANTAARESHCPGTASGDCRYCQRPKGIPILPVRYSVCRIEDNPNLRALPDDRVSAFTQIGLDKQTVDGVEQTKAPVNQYILRRLRQGYLYVYDEGNGDWYGFAVASTGELQQFPVAEPPDEPPGDFACVHEGHSDKASFFTLTNAESVTRVFIAYTEHAWPRAHLREKGNDAAWREQHMQCLDASAWVGSQKARHAFPKEAIEQYLPELGESEAVYQASCHYSGVGSSRVAQCDGAPGLVSCMVERTGSLPESVPLMFAVNDEAGIIEELNAYRHEPAQRMQDFLEEGDNARKVLWLSARERLKNGFDASKAEKKRQIEESTAPRIEREQEEARQTTESRNRRYQNLIDTAESEEDRAYWREQRDAHNALFENGYPSHQGGQWERDNQLDELDRHSDKLEEEFEGLYRDEADGFESDYVELRDLCSEQTKRFDADYARWVDQHLERCVSRYSDSDLYHGIGASAIIADTLQGGVLGEDSLALWRRLVELDDKNALLIRAFAANLASLGEQLLETIRNVDTEQDALDRMTLGNWFSLYSLARTSSVNFRDVDTTRRTMAKAWRNLQNVVSDVSVALGMRDQALSRGASQTQPVPMIRLGRLLQIGAMGDPDAPDSQSRASYLVELDIEVGEFRSMIRYVAENSGEPKLTKNDAYQFVDPEIDTPNRSGNFASVDGEDTARVRTLWQIRETDLDHLAGYLDCERVRNGGSFLHVRVEDGMARELARQKVSAMKSANPALTGMARLFLVMGVIGALRSANASDWQPESWWKLLSPTLAVASLGAGMASGRYERRAARQGIAASSQSLETAARLSRFGQVTGAVGNVIGIIDAFSMLADAEKAERQGELSQFTDTKYLLVGVNVVGAVVGLIFSSALVVPLLISLFAIWIAGQIIHYVPLGIRVWVRRSIFGVPGRQEAPFASLEEEQESLEMVIRGISVDIDVIQRMENSGAFAAFEQVDHRGEEPYYFSVKLSFPEEMANRGLIFTVDQFAEGVRKTVGAYRVKNKAAVDSEGNESTSVGFDNNPVVSYGDGVEELSPHYDNNEAFVTVKKDLIGNPERMRIDVEQLPEGGGVKDYFLISIKG